MKILVVSPHPDDETLGAGGTLLKMKKQKNGLYWLNITDMKVDLGWSEQLVSHRREQIKRVCECYSFDGFYNLELPPAKLASINENIIIDSIRKVFEEIKPEWIMLPGAYDAHSDHRVVYNCCMACAKQFRALYIKRITTMEIISETDNGFQEMKFEPNLFVDISSEMDDKLEVMKIYDTEIGNPPFPRSLERLKALAIMRGGYCASRYAEAFSLVRQVE